MNKTISINLGGFAFQIEENAFELLQTYLKRIRDVLGESEETTEIINDIESRIAELFNTDVKTSGGVITLEAVQEIIKLVGEPEDFVFDDEAGTKEKAQQASAQAQVPYRKTLFRDIENKVFGGVCSGLALYLNIDPVILRLIFVVAFYFWHPVVVIYLILWIAMPKPRTPAQWVEMKGGPDYFKMAGGDAKNSAYGSPRTASSKTAPNNTYYSRDPVANGLKNSANVVSVIIGLFLAVVSFIGLITLVVFMLFQNSALGEIIPDSRFIYELPHRFLLSRDISVFSVSIGLLAGIPLLSIFYLGLKLIFRFPVRGIALGVVALLLWLAGLAIFFYQSVDLVKSYNTSSNVVVERELNEFAGDTLYINTLKSSPAFRHNQFLMNVNKIDLYHSYDGHLIVQGEPDIVITTGNKLKITVNKKARGANKDEAGRNAEYTEYYWQQRDSVLLLDKYFSLGDQALIRNQKVTITIRVPENMNVKISPKLKPFILRNNIEEDKKASYTTTENSVSGTSTFNFLVLNKNF